MTRRRIVVLGTVASDPYAGMAWMHLQIAVGLLRLGHDVTYLETTTTWPYDPIRGTRVGDSDYALPYLARVMAGFGMADRWAYRRSYLDGAWLGPAADRATALLAGADCVLNVSGSTCPGKDGLAVGRLVLYGTDPVHMEVEYAAGDPGVRAQVDEHRDVVTYGENIGRDGCPIPPLPRLRGRTRQPVLLDLWDAPLGLSSPDGEGGSFTTVCNWRQSGRDLVFGGETYTWSKHHEFLRFIDLPRRVEEPIELAMGLGLTGDGPAATSDAVCAPGMTPEERRLLDRNGWRLKNAHGFTTDPWPYRDYILGSRGEWTVAKDQNVRLASGWFSERSACYLAASRPVVTQDTGFGRFLPTGEGLFAFTTTEEAVAAIAAIRSDWKRHARAARAIAEEYFRAETVLARLLADLGL